MSALTVAAQLLGLSAGLVAGVFLAFSDFVMPGLKEAGPGAGSEAMRGLNRTVYNSVFLILLKAIAPLALALMVIVFFLGRNDMAMWLGLGAVSHILFVMLVTLSRNVPMNTRLQSLAGEAPGSEAYWPDYVARWTGWNHVRTVGAAFTCLCFMLAAIA